MNHKQLQSIKFHWRMSILLLRKDSLKNQTVHGNSMLIQLFTPVKHNTTLPITQVLRVGLVLMNVHSTLIVMGLCSINIIVLRMNLPKLGAGCSQVISWRKQRMAPILCCIRKFVAKRNDWTVKIPPIIAPNIIELI